MDMMSTLARSGYMSSIYHLNCIPPIRTDKDGGADFNRFSVASSAIWHPVDFAYISPIRDGCLIDPVLRILRRFAAFLVFRRFESNCAFRSVS